MWPGLRITDLGREKTMKRTMCVRLCVMILAGGCTTAVSTSQGRPEARISGQSGEIAARWLLNLKTTQGWTLVNDSARRLVFEQAANDLGSALLYGSRYDSTPVKRAIYTIIESEMDTRVLLEVQIITNPGSAFERITRPTRYHQQWYDEMKDMELSLATGKDGGH